MPSVNLDCLALWCENCKDFHALTDCAVIAGRQIGYACPKGSGDDGRAPDILAVVEGVPA
jgi:hypothetical protein